MGKEIRLIGYVVGLYVCFISWGYLQEKITSTTYEMPDGQSARWRFPLVLNLFMAASACVVAALAELAFSPKPATPTPFHAFMYPAATCALASPIGYAALDYINFPLMILTKSSKPVPVMLIGVVFFGQRYTWYKYMSVLLICGGIILFSAFKSKNGAESERTVLDELLGIVLVTMNLFLDGYTSNQQDYL